MNTMTAQEVVDALDGRLSYRRLDYYCRMGIVAIEGDADGSGTRRRFTAAEFAAIKDLIEYIEHVRKLQATVTDGSVFADALRVAQYTELVQDVEEALAVDDVSA